MPTGLGVRYRSGREVKMEIPVCIAPEQVFFDLVIPICGHKSASCEPAKRRGGCHSTPPIGHACPAVRSAVTMVRA